MKLGAFGWAMHVPDSPNENREAKRRPCVVVMERAGKFIVVFGRSEPRGERNVPVSEAGQLGKCWGLKNETYFEARPWLLRPDAAFELKGFFLTEPDENPAPNVFEEYDLWLKLRGLASR